MLSRHLPLILNARGSHWRILSGAEQWCDEICCAHSCLKLLSSEWAVGKPGEAGTPAPGVSCGAPEGDDGGHCLSFHIELLFSRG